MLGLCGVNQEKCCFVVELCKLEQMTKWILFMVDIAIGHPFEAGTSTTSMIVVKPLKGISSGYAWLLEGIPGWWFQPLWKILVSWDYYYSTNIWGKTNVPNHQPDIQKMMRSIVYTCHHQESSFCTKSARYGNKHYHVRSKNMTMLEVGW